MGDAVWSASMREISFAGTSHPHMRLCCSFTASGLDSTITNHTILHTLNLTIITCRFTFTVPSQALRDT